MAATPRGLWIWQLSHIASDYVNRIKSCSVGRVYLKVLDGDSFWSNQCTTEVITAIKAAGAEVFGWGYHYAKPDPSGEVAAFRRAKTCGLDGYVIDIEKEAENVLSYPNVQKLLSAIREIDAAFPLGYSSFGAVQFHQNMPWEILNSGTDFFLPQIYYESWTFKPNPTELVDACMSAARSLPTVKLIYPVWGSEDRAVHPATPSGLQVFLDQYDGSSIWRAPQGTERGEAWNLLYDGDSARSRPHSGPSEPAIAPTAARLLCAQPKTVSAPLPAGLAPERASAIEIVSDKWVNGTVLHYCFLQSANWDWADAQKEVVRWAFATWKNLGIGLSFAEIADATDAEICIGAGQTDGSWSFIGTDILKYKDQGRTMNFGWDLRTEWGHATALHEIGHTLGLAHEHQNPKAGIQWNESAVYAYFSGPPNNWTQDTILNNILQKIPSDTIDGSSWDPHSIMEYPFNPGLIIAPKPYDTTGIPENTTLAPTDINWVKSLYPETFAPQSIAPMDLRTLGTTPGDQSDFVFEPQATRSYTVQTLGQSDSKIVIFEDRDGEPRYLSGGDDSGTEDNVALSVRMIKGKKYTIRVRTHYSSGKHSGLIVV